MSLRLCKQAQRDRKRHGEEKDEQDLDEAVVLEAEERDDGRHEQHDGQDGDDEAREDVDAVFGPDAHARIGGGLAVEGGYEEALRRRTRISPGLLKRI